jgi:FkbM family methyltransferase
MIKRKLVHLVRRVNGTNQIIGSLADLKKYLEESSPRDEISNAKTDFDPSVILRNVILASDSTSYFNCNLNGFSCWLPTETLRTMIHCVTLSNESINVLVETAHIEWMMDRIEEGQGERLFIDVGAATGAATLPIALKFNEKVKIVAFEPAIAALRLLNGTLEKNNITGIEVAPSVVGDSVGNVRFIEYQEDPTGNCPFLPEASTISHPGAMPGDERDVPQTTLDYYFKNYTTKHAGVAERVVIKIDVEGFEVQVLRGALELILRYRPYFSIDIHQSVDGSGMTTESACRQILGNCGYGFQVMGHVLLCSPDMEA